MLNFDLSERFGAMSGTVQEPSVQLNVSQMPLYTKRGGLRRVRGRLHYDCVGGHIKDHRASDREKQNNVHRKWNRKFVRIGVISKLGASNTEYRTVRSGV